MVVDFSDMAIKNKRGKNIRIQIKTTERTYRNIGYFKLTNKRNELNYIGHYFDFVFVTDLKDIWIIPYECIKRKSMTITLSHNFAVFKKNVLR